jgi:hypothetical protein
MKTSIKEFFGLIAIMAIIYIVSLLIITII